MSKKGFDIDRLGGEKELTEREIADRNPRKADQRDTEMSARDEDRFQRDARYSPPSALPDVEMDDGTPLRWVRTATLGQKDDRNVLMARHEGWEPVLASEVPDVAAVFQKNGEENIEIGGLILCKNSREFIDKREAYYADKNRRIMESVDNNLMSTSDPRMPILQPARRSRTTFGKKR